MLARQGQIGVVVYQRSSAKALVERAKGMSKQKRSLAMVVTAFLLLALAACKGDPNVKKQNYLESGNRYFENKQYLEAIIEYRNAIQLDPQFAEAHYKLGKSYLSTANYLGALQELQQAVSLQPSNVAAQVDLGTLYLAARKYQDAEQAAAAVLEKDDKNADAHALMANACAAQNKLLQAQTEFDKALELDPNNANTQFSVALFESRKGNKAGAEQRMVKAIQLDPKLLVARTALADIYISNKNFDAAERTLKEGITADPKDASAYRTLAQFYEFRNRRDDAVKLLTEAKSTLKEDPAAYRSLADFYLTVGDNAQALQEFASLAKEYPRDKNLRITYVELLVGAKRLDEAYQLIDAMLKENARDQQAIILKSGVLNLQQKNADALALLQPLSKDFSDNAAAHLQMGNAYNGLGQISQAESEWREAVRLNPNLLEAQLNLASLAAQKSDAGLLRSCSEKMIELRPKAAVGYLYRAISKSLQRDLIGAEADLNKVISLAPDSPDGYTKLGTLRGLQKRYPDAEQMFETALMKDANSGEALAGLIGTYEMEKKPAQKSIARVNAQIAKAPQNGFFWTLLGRVQNSAGDKNAAKASFQHALSLNGKDAAALTMLGELQSSTGDWDGAAASYQKLADANPRSATPLIMLGTLEQSRGNFQRAQQLFQKALDVEPNHPVAANNLAYLMLEAGGNLDVAITLAQTAVRGMPNNPSTADTLGWAYYRKGVYGSAREVLESAAKIAPENATIQFHLGMTYDKIANQTEATAHLKRALELAPKGPNAALIRQTLASEGRQQN